MGDEYSACGADFGYEIGWDDPDVGTGHIEVKWNPENEPGFVVSETRHYCSVGCVQEYEENIPGQFVNNET